MHICNVDYLNKEVKPVFGGAKFIVTLGVEVGNDETHRTESYEVKAEILTFDSSVELRAEEVTLPEVTTEHTLCEEAIIDLVNDHFYQ